MPRAVDVPHGAGGQVLSQLVIANCLCFH
jgi:hypothetical protein